MMTYEDYDLSGQDKLTKLRFCDTKPKLWLSVNNMIY